MIFFKICIWKNGQIDFCSPSMSQLELRRNINKIRPLSKDFGCYPTNSTIYTICFLHLSIVGNFKNATSYDSLGSVLARRNNISSYSIICQSPLPSVFNSCLFFIVIFHFTFPIFTLHNTFTTCMPLNSLFLSEFLFCSSLSSILARLSILVAQVLARQVLLCLSVTYLGFKENHCSANQFTWCLLVVWSVLDHFLLKQLSLFKCSC